MSIESKPSNLGECIAQLQEIIACQICYSRAADALMCPFCSKIYCQTCILPSLHLRSDCPNCRRPLKTMGSCSRFIDQIQQIAQKFANQPNSQLCLDHALYQDYFCLNCSKAVCCECEMFGTHRGHQLRQIKVVFEEKTRHLKKLISSFKQKMACKKILLQQLKSCHNQAKQCNHEQLTQLHEFERDAMKMHGPLNQNQNHLRHYIEEVRMLESKILLKIDSDNQNCLYIKDLQVEEQVKCLSNIAKIQNYKRADSLSEIAPPFLCLSFDLVCYGSGSSALCCESISLDGFNLKVKVFSEGNQGVENQFLSILLELTESEHQFGTFDFGIELIHQQDKKLNIRKNYQSQFRVGESWGFNKFCELSQVKRQFVKDESKIQIIVSIRQALYWHQAQSLKQKAEDLRLQISEQENTIDLWTGDWQQSATSINTEQN